jgi:hypothetical protein
VTDLEIITKPARAWATVHANTEDGRAWITRLRGEGTTIASIPAAVVTEYVLGIAREKLTVTVRGAP